jgi:CSLREA domain-containing protein
MTHKQLLKAALVLAMVLSLLSWSSHPAQAALLTVNTTDDADDGTCNASHCSLREAIEAANNAAGPDAIQFNIPPADPGCSGGVCTIQPGNALPALTDDGTIIGGYSQPGATPATATTPAVLKIELDGSKAGAWSRGLRISSADNVIAGLVINRFGADGIDIHGSGATGNAIVGSYIGTDAKGTVAQGNTWSGVGIRDGSQSNTIGGDTPARRNVISGNADYGVDISGSDTMSNTVSGNYIGTDVNGTAVLSNTRVGVFIRDGAQNNTIGGDRNAGEGNVISGNEGPGVRISGSDTMSNTVSGNYIGTDASGTLDRGNSDGIHIDSAQNNTVGGDTEGERNVISGNGGNGVKIVGSTVSNTVSGNYIGLAANGTDALGNTWYGVYIENAPSNTVGPDNVIAHNGWDGVEVNGASSSGNTITQNSIFSNTMGIDLVGDANGNIAAPTIMTTTVVSVNIGGEDACPGCTVELFENGDTDGEGETYVGHAIADPSGHFTVTVSHLTKPYLTATATDVVSGTSEFSAVFTATVPLGGPVYVPLILGNN